MVQDIKKNTTMAGIAMDASLKKITISEGLHKKGGLMKPKEAAPTSRPPAPPPQKKKQ